jgi:itaconyl-CoA hydratase
MTVHDGWAGRFYEDFTVGDVYRHPLGRTITTTDNIWFTLLTQNTAPLHFDHDYAAKTEFGKPLVNSTLTLSLVAGQSVSDVSQNVYANLGWREVVLPHPVFEGDTIRSRSTVLSARPSSSRPTLGVIGVQTEGFTQNDDLVIRFERTLLVYKRGHGPRASKETHD